MFEEEINSERCADSQINCENFDKCHIAQLNRNRRAENIFFDGDNLFSNFLALINSGGTFAC